MTTREYKVEQELRTEDCGGPDFSVPHRSLAVDAPTAASANSNQATIAVAGRGLAVSIGLLSLVAIGISAYLAWVAMTSAKVAGCGGGHYFDCNDVISSRWSRWLGVPVSLLAAGMYITLLASTSLAVSTRIRSAIRRHAWTAVTVLGFSAGLAALWFISLQAFVVKHFCSYCLAAHACGLAISTLLLWKRPLGMTMTRNLLLVSAFALGILVSGQLIVEPVTYKIIEHQPPASNSDANLFEFEPVSETDESGASVQRGAGNDDQVRYGSKIDSYAVLRRGGWRPGIISFCHPLSLFHSQLTVAGTDRADQVGKRDVASPAIGNGTPTSSATPRRRIVSINGGTSRLDIAQWPVVGSREAKHVFVEMFDYSCDHCRRTHAAIVGAKQRLGDDLAIIMLPVPLNTKCNSAVRATGVRMVEACELAQVAITVWQISPARFGEFHDYLMTTPSIATYSEAKAKAAELVGQQELDRVLSTGISNQYIARHVELYRRVGAGNVPKLLFPGTTVVGKCTSVDGLVRIIEQQSTAASGY